MVSKSSEKHESISHVELIKMAMSERDELRKVGSEIIELISPYLHTRVDDPQVRVKIEQKILEFSQHLNNLAGFCDDNMKQLANDVTFMLLNRSMIRSEPFLFLHTFLPTLIGLQVDFTKKPPFKTMKFELSALKAKITAMLKR